MSTPNKPNNNATKLRPRLSIWQRISRREARGRVLATPELLEMIFLEGLDSGADIRAARRVCTLWRDVMAAGSNRLRQHVNYHDNILPMIVKRRAMMEGKVFYQVVSSFPLIRGTGRWICEEFLYHRIGSLETRRACEMNKMKLKEGTVTVDDMRYIGNDEIPQKDAWRKRWPGPRGRYHMGGQSCEVLCGLQ